MKALSFIYNISEFYSYVCTCLEVMVRKVRPVNLVFLDYMLFAGEDTLGSLDIWYC